MLRRIWCSRDCSHRSYTRKGNTVAKKSELLKYAVRGGFTEELYEVLRSDSRLVAVIVGDILSEHFPESIHEDILSAVGLQLVSVKRAYRDPKYNDARPLPGRRHNIEALRRMDIAKRITFVCLAALLAATGAQAQEGGGDVSPADNLPAHITRLTHFGQRADWSRDGKRILFLAKTFGDVYEIDLESREIRPVTHHFYHEGFVRALYLANGDVLLSGSRTFSAEDPEPSRWENAELWVLDRRLDRPPVPVGTKASEGPAVSRTKMRIAWTIDHGDYPDRLPEGVDQIRMADIVYDGETPRLANERLVLDSRDLDFEADLETQNFRPPLERELTFSAYGYQGSEVMGVDLETGAVTNYSNSPLYEEPEGIFPDGAATLVESDRHRGGGYQTIDVYKLQLDGSGELDRVTTFNDHPEYKASNPVVSDDGRYIAFQMAKFGDPAGVGRGLFIYDIEKAK